MSGYCYLWINLPIPFLTKEWIISTSNITKKYSTVTHVLKMALNLPHGNADVEKGLSENNTIITKDRNQLREAAINGLRAKDAVKFYYTELMRPEKLLMIKHVLSSAGNAYFDYQRRGELQKGKQEKERRELNQRRETDEMKQKEREQLMEQKASLTEKEKSLDEGEKKLKHSLAAVLDLLMEENERMKSAVEKDDLRKVATAQLILDTATTKTGEYNQKLEEIRKKQKDFDHRKRKLLESCLDVNSEKKRKTSKEQK